VSSSDYTVLVGEKYTVNNVEESFRNSVQIAMRTVGYRGYGK
jgi:hypothetical protein